MQTGTKNFLGKVFLKSYTDTGAAFTIPAATAGQVPVYYLKRTSSATWTLPAVAANSGFGFFIKNRSATAGANITLQSVSGAIIFRGSSSDKVASMTIDRGSCIFIWSDGTYWYVLTYMDI